MILNGHGALLLFMDTTNKLTEREIIRAATNDAALSDRTFQLGDREFKVVDLDYDNYLKFLTLMQPLLEAVAGTIASHRGVALATTGEKISVGALIGYCSTQLPEMARIVCSATDPDINISEIKKLAKTPFKLAEVVITQIEQNNIIRDISDFFAQSLRLLQAVMPQSMSDTTPSE